eukprot:CAMPEP_0206602036 /NCGR_PEP_ID=MMETSP0325_2-20121206/47070_1 /ASSEMBLY_ACC=CAM_ASM_000347 /TAXON_ID=2866 /ORGANISM="Crypthecodinium cohnii, Strain Seligo" /LENGTH=51 /DNA_ID=CAMNT_0054114291 /DNA_START=1250 /DNA_END=1405 /DNA_ORIENTATION=+
MAVVREGVKHICLAHLSRPIPALKNAIPVEVQTLELRHPLVIGYASVTSFV